uniref:Uncharacterized protein n=1 Tax=Lotus japonicus TaxID=34305 RepID=I3SQG2_LOTJA|nr:unknown [Lotus japonicus]
MFFPDKASLNQKLRHLLALITLELNYLPQLLILHNIPVAAKLLPKILEDLLVAELLLQPLHCGQAFLSIPLLNAYMHIPLGSGGIRFFSLSKWIKRGWDLDFQLNHVLCLLKTCSDRRLITERL